MMEPCRASDFPGDRQDSEFHPDRRAPRLAPIDGQLAHPQAEDGTGRRLFVRDTHTVTMTADGLREFVRMHPLVEVELTVAAV